MHPHRPKLADQIARELQEAIENGKWTSWLPQERILAGELKISRSTLRLALNRLRLEGRIESLHSQGNRILARTAGSKSKGSRLRTVNLVTPGSAHDVRPTAVHWVEELRAQLAAKGYHLRILEARACYSSRPDRALEDLASRNAADCWIVRLSTLPMQQWFEKRGLPTILAGSCHPGINLPFVDVDHRALSRHATGAIIAAGHRRISLFIDRDRKAGDLESERGFGEGVAAAADHSDIEATITRYAGSVDDVVRQLDRLLKRVNRPTALLITQSIYCLTIWTHLGFSGVKVPADLSLVTQVGTSDLSYLVPEPTSYRLSALAYAQKFLRAVVAQISGDSIPQATRILPDYVRGRSLARPPPDGEGHT